MKKSDLAVAVYNTHTEAEEAVKALENAGFDMKRNYPSWARTTTARSTW